MKEKIREILENNFRSEAIDKIAELIINYKEFEPGWYWCSEFHKKKKEFMVYIKQPTLHKSFGFTPYFNKGDIHYSESNIRATRGEVLEMFINEFKRRDIVNGVKVNSYELSDDMLMFDVNGYLFFNNGKWAEVVKEKNLDELYKDYLNNMKFVRITDYIRENKEKFLIALNNL